uniref:Uncharacterized protein n=1 Tax=Anopheles christyi TaxID=43041 RepID=A0A182KI49_9DIPT
MAAMLLERANNVQEELLRILLLLGGEVRMSLTDQCFEHGWCYATSAGVRCVQTILRENAVPSAAQSRAQLCHLHIKIIGRIGREAIENRLRTIDEPSNKVRNGKQHLHYTVQIARVAQVLHTGVSRPSDRFQLTSALAQNSPLADSLVQIQLQLNHGLFRLLQLSHINPPVSQMLHQVWIFHHIVFAVAVDITLSIGRNRS